MIFKRIILIITFLPAFTVISCGQTQPAIPKEFVETIPPKFESKEWLTLNYSQNQFGVSIVNGKLDVKKVRELDTTILKIPSGSFIGIDRGEWGGRLTFKPSDPAKKPI